MISILFSVEVIILHHASCGILSIICFNKVPCASYQIRPNPDRSEKTGRDTPEATLEGLCSSYRCALLSLERGEVGYGCGMLRVAPEVAHAWGLVWGLVWGPASSSE
jgi:hypothetical protein